MLEPLLGAAHFRAGVSAEVDLTSGEQSEELFDPQKSVMASSQTSEDGPALASASGVPGTASALPRPTSKPSTGSSNYARRTENVSYQTSRVVKHTRLPQGTVKRLSLSVLVDHTVRWENAKRVIEAPSPEKLKVIHDIVAAAAGLDPARGDQLVIETLPFESTLSAEPTALATPEEPSTAQPFGLPAWGKRRTFIFAGSGLGVLLAAVAAFVILRRKKKPAAALAAGTGALAAAASNTLSTDDAQKQLEGRMAEQQAEHAREEVEAMMSFKLPKVKTKKTEVLMKHIVAEAKIDADGQARVVRTWLNG